MKKLKQLLVISLALIMCFSLAACDSCGGSDATLESISVDSSGATTTFYVGYDFSSEGIVVTATYSDESTSVITSDNYTLDSSSYVKSSVGTYTIKISYTEDETTVETSYDVKVQVAPAVDLELDTSTVKTLYTLYQDISYTGLTAKVTYADRTTDTLTERQLDAKSPAFDNTTAGKYMVLVSYTYGGSTVTGTYYV